MEGGEERRANAEIFVDHIAYTVYLNVRFRKPLYTPQVVVVRGRVQRREGKKLYMKGRFENKDGEVISEAEGMWVMFEKGAESSDIRVAKL
jgi:acyl-CoA thioesterase FadM